VFLTADNYSTDYLVRLTLKPRLAAGDESPYPTTVVVDGFSRNYSAYMSNPTPLSQWITVNFTDPRNVLTVGWDIGEFIELYYGEAKVAPVYYDLQVAPVASSRAFSRSRLPSARSCDRGITRSNSNIMKATSRRARSRLTAAVRQRRPSGI
jgi:hypothetical protein